MSVNDVTSSNPLTENPNAQTPAVDGEPFDPVGGNTNFDPNNQEQFQYLMEQAILRQFAMKMGLKIMSSVRNEEPISFI